MQVSYGVTGDTVVPIITDGLNYKSINSLVTGDNICHQGIVLEVYRSEEVQEELYELIVHTNACDETLHIGANTEVQVIVAAGYLQNVSIEELFSMVKNGALVALNTISGEASFSLKPTSNRQPLYTVDTSTHNVTIGQTGILMASY